MKQFIVCFLRLNPNPSDRQIHLLSEALGVDKEIVEAIIFSMLGSVVNAAVRLRASIEVDDVLQDEVPPEEIPNSLLPTNDGELSPEHNLEMHDILRDDGGFLPEISQDLMRSDGMEIKT